MDVGGGSSGGRGVAAALALLSLHRGQAANVLACAARLRPRAAGRGQRRSLRLACVGVGPLTRWLTLHTRGPGKKWGKVRGTRGRIHGRLQR
jgi:hypothetical protein